MDEETIVREKMGQCEFGNVQVGYNVGQGR